MKSKSKIVIAVLAIVALLLLAATSILAFKLANCNADSNNGKPELSIEVLERSSELSGSTMKFDLVLANTFKRISTVDVMFSLEYVENGISEKQISFDDVKDEVNIHVELESDKAEELYAAIVGNSVMTFKITQENKEEIVFGVTFKEMLKDIAEKSS